MAAFQRKGTVSKSSGPMYINSYALKGVSIKFTPPIPVQDPIVLPSNWKQPKMLLEEHFRYNYSREHRVLEHGKQRALSVAAQAEAASLNARMIEAARQANQRLAEQQQAELDPADSPPSSQTPIIPTLSSTILTPTPVTTAASSSGTAFNHSTGDGGSVDGAIGAIKSLGEMSIREFEGDNNDPFEIASLQAINDMEVLQSVLQPTVCTAASTMPLPSSTATSPQTTAVVSMPAATARQVAHSQPHPQLHTQPPTAKQLTSSHATPAAADLAVVFGSPPVSSATQSTASSSLIQQQQQAASVPLSSVLQKPPPPIQQHPPSSVPQQPLSVPQQPSVRQQPLSVPQQPLSVSQQPTSVPQQPTSVPQQPTSVPQQPPSVQQQPPLIQPQVSNMTTVSHTNPFLAASEVSSSQSGGYPSTNPFMVAVSPASPPSSTPGGAGQEPSVGTLIEIEPHANKPATATPVTQMAPVPMPRGHPVTGQAPTPMPRRSPVVAPEAQTSPVPIPRGRPATAEVSQTLSQSPIPVPRGHPATTQTTPIPVPQVPPPYTAVASPHSAQPQSLQQPSLNGPMTFNPGSVPPSNTLATAGVPPVPPKPSPRCTATPSPPIPPKGIKVSQTSGTTTLGPPKLTSVVSGPTSFPTVHNRFGLGVPVLPPISHTSSIPAPEQPDRPSTPPPPYFAEQETERRHPPPPCPSRSPTYKLPDPMGSLSGNERKEVGSYTAMGFPPPRVARTIRRLGSEDKTKIFDFLILIGRLEDQGYNGDSAETALLVSKDDFDKALDYLKRLKGYKEIGFAEKAIHEAYNKADGDWDKALDILTQGR